jgi:hypothetical protein
MRTIKLAMELIYAGIEDGGGTFTSNGDKVTAKTGYVVGGKRKSLVMRLPHDKGIIAATERAAEWLDKGMQVLYYGSWVDGDILYIDAVDIIQSRATAVHVGKLRGEEAIWDLAEGKEVRLEEQEEEA